MELTSYGVTQKVSDVLYHYTGREAFESIMSHKSGIDFCATHYLSLNDDREYTLGCEFALKWLRGKSQLSKASIKVIEERLHNKIEFDESPWILSFTENYDRAEHWMAYSSHEKGGVAIGLSADMIRDVSEKIDARIKSMSMKSESQWIGGSVFAPCIYTNEKSHYPPAKFIRMLDYVFSQHESFFPLLNREPARYARFCARHITKIISLLKDDEFRFEKECRLVVFPCENATRNEVRLIGDKPRLSLKHVFRDKSIVNGVIISPHGQKELIAMSAEIVKSKYDYGYDVIKSQSNYNGK